MVDCSSLKEYTDMFDEAFGIKLSSHYLGSVTHAALFFEDECGMLGDRFPVPDYTEKIVFYVYVGSMIVKYGENIVESFLELVNLAINEVEKNYRKLDLTPEEQEEILAIAVKLKGDLPKLKVFKSSLDIFPLEKTQKKG